MKMPTRGKNPPVLRPAPFGKGGHSGIFRLCFERGAAHFHLLCRTDWYMNYFAEEPEWAIGSTSKLVDKPVIYKMFGKLTSSNWRNK